jgi:hypothetical protein
MHITTLFGFVSDTNLFQTTHQALVSERGDWTLLVSTISLAIFGVYRRT